MTGSYPSADIKASITLNTSDFQKALSDVKNQASNHNRTLNSSVGKGFGDGLKSSLESLKAEFSSLIDESQLLDSINTNIKKLANSLLMPVKLLKQLVKQYLKLKRIF